MQRTFDSGWLYRIILGLSALLIPREERGEWLAEWTAELWHLASANRPGRYFSLEVTQFCLGSWKDAAWLRQNSEHRGRARHLWLRSPLQCMSVLLVLAFGAILRALDESLFRAPYTGRQLMLSQLFVLGTALLILVATAGLSLGQYPATLHAPTCGTRLRRWIFLVAKLTLVLSIVFCGTLDFGPVIASQGIRPLATLIGYVFAVRWVLMDQRRRCPVCLRLLTSPVRIGQSSRAIFDWCGTEYMCTRGHGLLHVPEGPTVSFSAQQWLYLDSSWQNLFVD